MGHIKSDLLEAEAVRVIAAIMAAASRTAPKANGIDSVDVAVVDGEDLQLLAEEMQNLSKQKPAPYPSRAFRTNGDELRRASAVILIGVTGSRDAAELPLDCGACGFKSCAHLKKVGRRQGGDFVGPTCILKALDLGIAIGSAVKTAGEFHIDNRIMYTVGAAAMRLGLLNSDVIMGIPLATAGKNPFYDRAIRGTLRRQTAQKEERGTPTTT
jgi:uncharacterized ferredoxin-like protein